VSGTVALTVNGRPEEVPDDGWSLLDVLRERLGLRSVKDGCSPQGQCGCCTVLVDGVAVSGCLYLATLAEGAQVETVECSATLDEVQEAFIERAAFQCGFCTPGFILMTRQLLAENPDPSEDDIRHYLSGNLCRCAAYPEIVEAVKLAARKKNSGPG